nr:MAG TPA: relaxase [Caudoviricetes sp.]
MSTLFPNFILLELKLSETRIASPPLSFTVKHSVVVGNPHVHLVVWS